MKTKSIKSVASLVCAVAMIFSLCSASLSVQAANYNRNGVISAILNGMKNFSETIDVSRYNIPESEFEDLYYDIVYDNSELFYLKTGFSYTYGGSKYGVLSVSPAYLYSRAQYNAMKPKFDAAVADYMSYISDDMTDYTKALILHDLLVSRNVYTESSAIPDESYTSYGALVKRDAVCQGYSMAYHYLLKLCGVESDYADSDEMGHVWNMVNIGGEYYHVDITWDDPRFDFNGTFEDIAGYVSHNYFLRTDKEMMRDADGNIDHFGWTADHRAVSTAYSNSFDKNIADTGVAYYDGYYYFINNSGVLVKQKQGSNTTQTVYKIERSRWNESSTSYKIWDPSDSRISAVGSKLYFTECKRILMIDMENDTEKPVTVASPVLSNSQCLYGIDIVGNEGYCDVFNASGSLNCRKKFELLKISETPSAPTLLSKTESSVTLALVSGCEYSMDKINWQKSNVFEGLAADKDYSFYIRVAEADGTLASNISNALTVHISSSIIYGDNNSDGDVNLLDLLTLRKHLAKWNSYIDLQASDCNCDGSTNLLDLILLRKYLAKWDVVLGPQS